MSISKAGNERSGDAGKAEIVELKLPGGRITTIDKADFDRVRQHRWFVWQRKGEPSYIRNHAIGSIHRFIMEPRRDQIVDHIDGDIYNNTRANLRVGTQAQNVANSVRQPGRYAKGVSYDARKRKFRAKIKHKGKTTHLGYFDSESAAGAAYHNAAKALHGDWLPEARNA